MSKKDCRQYKIDLYKRVREQWIDDNCNCCALSLTSYIKMMKCQVPVSACEDFLKGKLTADQFYGKVLEYCHNDRYQEELKAFNEWLDFGKKHFDVWRKYNIANIECHDL